MSEKKFEELTESVVWEGKEIRLTQDAYLEYEYRMGIHVLSPFYEARGIDKEGNEYLVIWSVVDDYDEILDEGDACDWENPWHVQPL